MRKTSIVSGKEGLGGACGKSCFLKRKVGITMNVEAAGEGREGLRRSRG